MCGEGWECHNFLRRMARGQPEVLSMTVSVSITRNVPATNEAGMPTLIALATVIHENGQSQTVAVSEAQAMFESGEDNGESFILREVERAVKSPQAPQLDFDVGK